MKRTIIIILTFFSLTPSYGQLDSQPSQNLELSAKNIKRLFFKPDSMHPTKQSEWIACSNADSTYSNADTIRLYNDHFYYLTTHCCYVTSWTFYSRNIFNLSNTKMCQEPPMSSMRSDDYGLKIKIGKKEENLILSIYKDGKLKDKFILLSLDNFIKKNGKSGCCLTMIRV